MSENRIVGRDVAPGDLVAKITGRARYSEDFRADGMLFAKMLLSPMPRARVRRIDARRALAMEGVVAIATAEDAPEVSGVQEPVFSDEPLYQGQPILAVAAVDEATAAEAIARIRVDLQPLPFVLDPMESLHPGGPDGRDGMNAFRGQEPVRLKWTRAQFDRAAAGEFPHDAEVTDEWAYGELEEAFARSALVLEQPIVHQSQTHHPLESRSAMAYWSNGKLFLHCSTQSVSQTKRAHAALLGIEEEDLVLISEYCGGAFGSKIRGTVTDLVPAILSRKAGGRPVMMRITREEETFIGRARAGLSGWTRVGFAADGKVLAIDLMLLQDNGPFGRQGDYLSAGSMISLAVQPEAMRFRGIPVVTNTPPKAAQRAPGGVQVIAMFQPILDMAARELGVDRLEMMARNAPTHDSVFGGNASTLTSAYAREAVELGGRVFNWAEKRALSGQERDGKVLGVGLSLAPYTAGSSGWDGLLVILPDGTVRVHQGIGNLGTHSMFDTARAAAEVLGVEWDRVEVVWGDSGRGLPWSSTQSGSQTTFAHTRANHAAAVHARRLLQELAALELGGSPDQYEVSGGRVFRRGAPGTGMSLAEAAQRAIARGGRFSGEELPEDINVMTAHAARRLAGQGLVAAARDNYPRDGAIQSFVVAFAVVALDRETGMIEVKELMGVADCGTVLHPRNLAAQVHGGIIQGASVARFERWAFDTQWGVNANRRFYTAKPTSILDVPVSMDFAAVGLPDPQTPLGAKGIGEPPICAGAGAMASAIMDAMGGVYIGRTPMSPDRILMALEGRTPAYGPVRLQI